MRLVYQRPFLACTHSRLCAFSEKDAFMEKDGTCYDGYSHWQQGTREAKLLLSANSPYQDTSCPNSNTSLSDA